MKASHFPQEPESIGCLRGELICQRVLAFPQSTSLRPYTYPRMCIVHPTEGEGGLQKAQPLLCASQIASCSAR